MKITCKNHKTNQWKRIRIMVQKNMRPEEELGRPSILITAGGDPMETLGRENKCWQIVTLMMMA